MKAAVLLGKEKIEVKEVDNPAIGDDEVLVKLKKCGICTLEQRLFTGEMQIYYPIIPGHEASGEIVKVGDAVHSAIASGTRVAIDLITRCGECHYCRTGKSNMCMNRFRKGIKILGGFGEYISVKASHVYPFPESLTFEEATFAEPVACCIHSLKSIQLTLGEDLLILGAGPMGLMHLQSARTMGARVFVSDPDEGRLQKALELGAAAVVNPLQGAVQDVIRLYTEGRGVDAAVVTTPAHSALENAIDSVAKTGRINVYTSYNDKPVFPVDVNTIHRSEYLITGTEGRTEYDFYQAVRLLSFGYIDVKPIISKTVGMVEIEEGIRAALSSKTYRVLLSHED